MIYEFAISRTSYVLKMGEREISELLINVEKFSKYI